MSGARHLVVPLGVILVGAGACGSRPSGPRGVPEGEPSITLDVLAYNVWFLSPVSRDDEERMRQMPHHLDGYDVVVLSEAFDDELRPQLLSSMEQRGYQATPVLGAGIELECTPTVVGPVQIDVELPVDLEKNGGVVVMSRHRLEHWQQKIFHPVCTGEDCCSAKGVMYARFRTDDGPCLHVFGTHLQNQSPLVAVTDPPAEVRRGQLEIIRAFIDEVADTAACPGPVIVAGDLNLQRHELDEALGILRAHEPEHFAGPRSWGEHNRYAESDAPEHLDYVLLTEDFRPAVFSSNETRIFRSAHGFTRRRFLSISREVVADLSDHHPVAGHFEWGAPVSGERLFWSIEAPDDAADCASLTPGGDAAGGRAICADDDDVLSIGPPTPGRCTPIHGCATGVGGGSAQAGLCSRAVQTAFCPEGLGRGVCSALPRHVRCVQIVDPASDDERRFDDYLCYRGAGGDPVPFAPITCGGPAEPSP